MADKEELVRLVSGRQTKLENNKTGFMARMQEVAEYVNPNREDVQGIRMQGDKKGTKVYDGTAIGAAVLAADGIHGYHVSPAFPWFKYIMSRKLLNKMPEIKEWLAEIEFNMYMALNRSNFYAEMWTYIYDGVSLGTPSMYIEEDIADQRIIFEAVHPGEVYISESRYGEVDCLHRKRKFTARQIVQDFGESNVPERIKQAYKLNPFQEFEILHAVFPREERDDRKKDAKNKKYASVWLQGKDLLKESGYDRFPYKVWRYMKSGKEPYAITPAMLAMADILGINLMSKTLLGAAQMAVDPPLNVPSDIMGKVQWKPRGLNSYDGATSKGIFPANTGLNFPVGIDREQAKQQAIRERFHVDTYLMLSQLTQTGQKTAYEVSELMAEKAAVLGAELGPLNTQLDGMLDYVYEIESEAGRMPQPPDALLEMAANDPQLRFDPIYMGPLAQAQRERFSQDGIKKFFIQIGPIAQLDLTVLDNIDMDEATRFIADNVGVPPEIMRDVDKRDAIRQGRQEAQQQMAQTEDALNMAEGIKKVASADKDTGGVLSKAMTGAMNNAPA